MVKVITGETTYPSPRERERKSSLMKRIKEKLPKVGINTPKTSIQKLSQKLPSKRILKKSQATVTISQKEVPSVLNDPNRFFKDEMEEVKRTMFLK